MFNRSSASNNNRSKFFLNLLRFNNQQLTNANQLLSDKNRKIQMLTPLVIPSKLDRNKQQVQDEEVSNKLCNSNIITKQDINNNHQEKLTALSMISDNLSKVVSFYDQSSNINSNSLKGVNETKQATLTTTTNSSSTKMMNIRSRSQSQNTRHHRLPLPDLNNNSFEAAGYNENKLQQASQQQEANRTRRKRNNELLTIKFVNKNNYECDVSSSTKSSISKSQQQQQQTKSQSRRQVLALQVERTFKRKIIGNLIVAIYCSLLILLLNSATSSHLALSQQVDSNGAPSTTTANSLDLPETHATPTDGPDSAVTARSVTETSTDPTSLSNNNTGTSSHTAQVKLKPVNFTLVDEIFDSVLSEDEVVKKWKFMDTQLQDGMKAILKMLFPQIVAISQDAKVSGDCSGGILKWILSLRNLRSWAIKMLDATGKPTSGIFEGSLTMYGNYKQCLNIRAPDEDEIEITEQFEEYFRGQYCIIHLKPWMPIKQPFYHLNSSIDSLLRKNYKYYEKTLYDELAEIAIAFNFVDIRMDLCVPSTCTMADIQRVAELLSKKVEMRAKVVRCDIASKESSVFNQLDKITIDWTILPIILFTLSLVSTIILLFRKLLLLFIGTSSQLNGVSYNDVDDFEHNHKSSSSGSISSNRENKLSFINLIKCLSIQHNLLNRFEKPNCCLLLNKNSSGSMDFQTESSMLSINKDKNIASFVSINNSNKNSSNRINVIDNNEDTTTTTTTTTINSNLLKPLPLYGLRSVFVFWFIIVQLTVELKYQYLRESLPLRDMIISYWPFQIIINSSLLFESLLLITAFTYSFTCLESSLKELIKYIFDKYLRLILSIITLISITILTPLLEFDSPIWKNFVQQQAMTCKSTGYLNLFFLQNFIYYDKICLPHTWLLSVELQLIILSIPIMLLFKQTFSIIEDTLGDNININNSTANVTTTTTTTSSSSTTIPSSIVIDKKLKLESNPDNRIKLYNLIRVILLKLLYSKVGLINLLLILTGLIINFTSVFNKQLPPSWFYTFPDMAQKNYYFSEYLIKTWTHLSVFMIGLFAGHICRASIQINSLNVKSFNNNRNSIYNINQEQRSSHSKRHQREQQPSPSSYTHLHQSYGDSTSTIMAMESPHIHNNKQQEIGQLEKHENEIWSPSEAASSSSTTTTSDRHSPQQQTKRGHNAINRSTDTTSYCLYYQLAAFVCMSAIIFSTFSWSTKQLPTPLVSGLYDALSRLFWSIALVNFMIYLCFDTDRQTLLAKILTHPLCTLLGRLSFLAYLISPYINTFILAVQEQALFPSLFIIFHIIVGNIVIIYLVAFILAILIEQPMRRLISRFVLSLF